VVKTACFAPIKEVEDTCKAKQEYHRITTRAVMCKNGGDLFLARPDLGLNTNEGWKKQAAK